MTGRTAKCGCGRLQVDVEGEPFLVSSCHCDFCQKRTGSVFGVEAYFDSPERITVRGETRRYNGFEIDGVGSISGLDASYFFCPTCGSTVYWTFTEPAVVGIAVGNLVDPDFPAPTMETSTRMRHHWVSPILTAQQLEGFPLESARLDPNEASE